MTPLENYPRIPANESERLANLHSYGVLDTPPEGSFDRITRLAAQLCQTSMAAVSLVDEHRQWFKSRLGLAVADSCRCESFCAHAILSDEVFVVPDAALDPRFQGNPFVVTAPNVRFYAGAPLRTADGIRVGTLCVLDAVPRAFSAEDAARLTDLAGIVVDTLNLRRLSQAALMESEGRVRWARDAAEKANAAKSEFLSRMSHHLRTPLNAVLGFSHLLQQQMTPGDQQECAAHIIKGGQRLLELINELLEVSRLQAGHLELVIEPLSVADVVRESVEAMRPFGAHRQIAIGICAESSRPYLVLADSQRLKQVLQHLLANAVKFSLPGRGIAVDFYPVGGQVRLSVHDRGPGIAPEQLERLFKPFERLGDDAAGPAGNGLGLVICRHLVEALGGTLGVTSRVGEGSVFWVQLPAAEAPPAAVEPRVVEPVFRPPDKPTVLYIDDDESNLKLIEYLVGAGQELRLLTAERGTSGLEIARAEKPDLILLDLQLPDLAGEEVLGRLRADPVTRDIPVVALSGDTAPDRIAHLTAAGVKTYLTKPIEISEVLGVLATLSKRPVCLPTAA